MEQAGIRPAAIQAFRSSYTKLVEGQSGLLAEAEIQPVSSLPRLEEIDTPEDESLLKQTVVIKLNGGLGTSMGLEGPKSLLEVKDGLTFLDFIARQILFLRKRYQQPLRFLLMNSFNTSQQTLEFVRRYPELGEPKDLELMQGLVPKVEAATLRPISWPANSQLSGARRATATSILRSLVRVGSSVCSVTACALRLSRIPITSAQASICAFSVISRSPKNHSSWR